MSTPTPATALEIVVDATYVNDVGYGRVWKTTVREVKTGALPDETVMLRTFVNNAGQLYGGSFRDKADQRGVTLTLRKIDKRPAALAGFIAADGTIWELTDTP